MFFRLLFRYEALQSRARQKIEEVDLQPSRGLHPWDERNTLSLDMKLYEEPFASDHCYPEAFGLNMEDLERGDIWLSLHGLLGWARRVVSLREMQSLLEGSVISRS